jgi:hypothetical protein
MIEAKPENLIGDRAYRYMRRWLVERLLRLDSMAAPDPHSLGVPHPTTSSVLSSLPASLSSSNDFETGSH